MDKDLSVAKAQVPSLSSTPTRKRKRNLDSAEIEVDVDALAPPSKKALRKAKKGKTTPADQPANSSSQSNEKSLKDEKRSEYGIWIGNLPWSATKADVRTFITSSMDIMENLITRIHMPIPSKTNTAGPGQKPQNKGFAYVDFSTRTAQQQAMTLSEKLLNGRRVLIKDSSDFKGKPDIAKHEGLAMASHSEKPPSKRIFVGNLGFDTVKEDLENHFERCGAVHNVHLATFEDSGKCKGYAWVEFEKLKAGEAAVRGWVNYDEGTGSNDEAGEESPSKAEKMRKNRKWWVNKLKGRKLRMEFAEDKAVRYKKRYSKDGDARKGSATDFGDHHTPEVEALHVSTIHPRPAKSKLATGAL